MRDYTEKKGSIGLAKNNIKGAFRYLHPEDKVEALRELQEWTGEKAAQQDAINDRDGVPEGRPEAV